MAAERTPGFRQLSRHALRDEEVGPEIDPDNPLKGPITYHEIFDIDKILNGPNPAEIVDARVVLR